MRLRRQLLKTLMEAIRRLAARIASRAHRAVMRSDQLVREVAESDFLAPVGVLNEPLRAFDASAVKHVLKNGSLNKRVGRHDWVTGCDLTKHFLKQVERGVVSVLHGLRRMLTRGAIPESQHADNKNLHGLEHAYAVNDLP